MKRATWWLSVGAAGVALGCAEEGEGARPESAVAMVAASGSAGAPGGASGGSGGSGSAAGAPSAAGAGAAPVAPLRLGAPLPLVAGTGEVPYAIGPNPYGIVGGGFLARSELGNTISIGSEPGEICISGTLEEVPSGNYGQYWGVEIGFNLNQGAPGEAPGEGGSAGTSPPPGGADAGSASGGAASADAGAGPAASDAAPPAEVARPWLPGDVIGFSFVIEGPTINLIRFKALPDGYDPALESSVFCKGIEAASGQAQSALFTEMTQYCWSSQAVPIPTAAGLANISWQLPADVAPAGPRPFDWCLKELRPILAP